MKSSGPQVSGRPSARPASCVQAQLGGMKKALAPASKQTQGQPVWGRGHCTTALFLCQFAPQGGEKLRQVLPAEKPRVVAATRGKPESLGRKITGFGIGLQVCATGWQRPGKPLFLPGTGWNTTEGKGSFHARATPQNPARKKRDSQRNADHKKDSAPGRKKPAFPAGLYSWCTWTLRGDRPAPARANRRKSPHRKKSSTHRGLYTTGITLPLYAGESQRITAIKKRAAQRRCWRAKVWETVRIKKAKSGEYKKEYPPSLWLLDGCPGDRRGEGFPTLAGFVVKGDALHGATFTCLLSCFPPIFPPHCPAHSTS